MYFSPTRTITLLTLLILSQFAYANEKAVAVIQPEVSRNETTLNLSGTISPINNAQLAPLTTGVIDTIHVEAGDTVTKGQTLLSLDVTLTDTDLRQADANLKIAQEKKNEAYRRYNEVIALSKQKVAAKTLIAQRRSEMVIANTEFLRAKALLENVEEIKARHTLTAPFNGLIAKRFVDVGEWVTNQTQSFQLVSNTQLRLELSVPQEYLKGFENKQNITVKAVTSSTSNQTLTLPVTRVINSIDPLTRTFTIFVNIPRNGGFSAGMSADAEIMFGQNKEVQITLPKSALKHHPDGGFSVFSVTNGIASRHIVTVSSQSADSVTLTGAPSDALYVIKGVELLNSGDKVNASTVTELGK